MTSFNLYRTLRPKKYKKDKKDDNLKAQLTKNDIDITDNTKCAPNININSENLCPSTSSNTQIGSKQEKKDNLKAQLAENDIVSTGNTKCTPSDITENTMCTPSDIKDNIMCTPSISINSENLCPSTSSSTEIRLSSQSNTIKTDNFKRFTDIRNSVREMRKTRNVLIVTDNRQCKSTSDLVHTCTQNGDGDLLSKKLKNENLATSTQAVPQALDEEISKDKQMSIGRKKFNIDPKKGIEYLIDNGLLTHNPKEIAQFLFTVEGLNKSQIGNYLGEFREFNVQVLQEFVNLQDFADLGILQALRQFLWTFHPPGEAQKIERILEGFSMRYFHMNPTAFSDSSGCFTLAFCIVILNTLLHNENVKQKPPLKVFVEMVNMEQDLPESMIEEIFENIKAEPFKKDDGDDLMHTFFNPDREGWLWKQGGRYKSWKRRWFIMTGKCLYYFEYTTDKEFRGIIPLENIKVREVDDRRMSNCFEIFSENSNIVKACKTSNGKVVEGRHRVYRISATSKAEKQQWMEAIRKSTMFNPLYKLLSDSK